MIPHPLAKCSKTLAANAITVLDVLKTKSILKALDHYDAPEWGLTQNPVPALFAAIEKFQRAQGLKVDGVMKPGGETEAALGQAMTPRRAQSALRETAQALQALGRGGDELLAHITLEEVALLAPAMDETSVNVVIENCRGWEAGGPGGVYVEAYTQDREGQSVGVSAHERSAPGTGSQSPDGGSSGLPLMKNPIKKWNPAKKGWLWGRPLWSHKKRFRWKGALT